jgi:two-component system, OmpR family, sensor histidine kinase MtrB
MSLRRNLTIALYVLGTLALIASVSLIVYTTYMSDSVTTLADALRSVYLAQRAEIDLLAHARTTNPVVATTLEQDLREKLEQAKESAEGPREEETLSRATKEVQDYLDASHRSTAIRNSDLPEFEPAVDALREVVDINLSHADLGELQAQRLDWWGDRIGMTVVALLIIGVGGVSTWLALYAFRPVFTIRDAMREFAMGNRNARAPELGPTELRIIASQFNAMADSLARQRENQLAFLAGVAHDLRNPLSVLKLATISPSPERVPIMKRQVDYLDRMIGDLLDASRIEAGQLELRPQHEDARALVAEVYDLFRDLSPSHQLLMSVPERPVMLYCDALRIEQVLNNLVSNAIKYSPKGGPVEIRLQDSDGEAIIGITDHGIGIPSDQRDHIFEPFRRAGLTKDKIPGIGLGLSVARRIVEAHHGQLEVWSELGKGSTFSVHLPYRADKAGRVHIADESVRSA